MYEWFDFWDIPMVNSLRQVPYSWTCFVKCLANLKYASYLCKILKSKFVYLEIPLCVSKTILSFQLEKFHEHRACSSCPSSPRMITTTSSPSRKTSPKAYSKGTIAWPPKRCRQWWSGENCESYEVGSNSFINMRPQKPLRPQKLFLFQTVGFHLKFQQKLSATNSSF